MQCRSERCCDVSDWPRDPFDHTALLELRPDWVPLRYRNAETSDQIALSWLAEPRGTLVIAGPVGVGKSHLAYALVMKHLQHCHPSREEYAVESRTVGDYLSAISPGRVSRDDEGTPDDPAQCARKADLLLFDDLGSSADSAWRMEQVFNVIDYRYTNMLPTIVTTNVLPSELSEVIGPRIASRLAHDATVIMMTGTDRRRA